VLERERKELYYSARANQCVARQFDSCSVCGRLHPSYMCSVYDLNCNAVMFAAVYIHSGGGGFKPFDAMDPWI